MLTLPGPKERELGDDGVPGEAGEVPENRKRTGGLFCSLTCTNVFQGWQRSRGTLPASEQRCSKGRCTLGPCRLRPLVARVIPGEGLYLSESWFGELNATISVNHLATVWNK